MARLSVFVEQSSSQLEEQVPMATAGRDVEMLRQMVRSLIPPLSRSMHKGQAGRIGVVGGSKDYTGAPYYAAISALKLGADLSYVFCSETAASVIKSYSPELIVVPLLDSADQAEMEMAAWIQRLHCLVVGPGLGRDPKMLAASERIIQVAKQNNKPLVIDADGLHLIGQSLDIIRGYENAILTPNAAEFPRLYQAVFNSSPDDTQPLASVQELSRELGNVSILHKGENDVLSNGRDVLICSEEGSLRRCGGQGDVLAGCLGTFAYWSHLYCSAEPQATMNALVGKYGPMLAAGYASCFVTRTCSKLAFSKRGRSMTTPNLLTEIQGAYDALI